VTLLATATSVNYPYFYIAPSNTGILTGFDMNNNGAIAPTISKVLARTTKCYRS